MRILSCRPVGKMWSLIPPSSTAGWFRRSERDGERGGEERERKRESESVCVCVI